MWFKNKETGLKFEIDNQDLIKNLKNDSNFIELLEQEEKQEEQSQEETPTRKDLNLKLKSLGYEGDLRKLSDEDAIIEIEKLENK